MNELDKLDLFDSNTVFNAESRNKIYSLFVKIYIPWTNLVSVRFVILIIFLFYLNKISFKNLEVKLPK